MLEKIFLKDKNKTQIRKVICEKFLYTQLICSLYATSDIFQPISVDYAQAF